MLRDIVLFLAGAEAFHTLTLLVVPHLASNIELSPSLNLWAILINGAITVVLLWLVSKMRRG